MKTLKVLVVGACFAGKTSLIKRYTNGLYSKNYRMTVGVDFAVKSIPWEKGQILLQMWDIAGQERVIGNMTRAFYKDAAGAFVVFDIMNQKTFEVARAWKRDIDQKISVTGTDLPIPTVLLANKIDLAEEEGSLRKTKEEMDNFCKENGFIGWAETSAKTGQGIDAAVKKLVSAVVDSEVTLNVMEISEDAINLGQVPRNNCLCSS
jgi:Ras-related protein Rab-32